VKDSVLEIEGLEIEIRAYNGGITFLRCLRLLAVGVGNVCWMGLLQRHVHA